jgi:hypothetical protein
VVAGGPPANPLTAAGTIASTAIILLEDSVVDQFMIRWGGFGGTEEAVKSFTKLQGEDGYS